MKYNEYCLKNYPQLRDKQVDQFRIFLEKCDEDSAYIGSLFSNMFPVPRQQWIPLKLWEYDPEDINTDVNELPKIDFQHLNGPYHYIALWTHRERKHLYDFKLTVKDLESENFKILKKIFLSIHGDKAEYNLRYFLAAMGSHSLELDFIFDNLNLPWDWCAISGRNDVTLELIKKYNQIQWVMEIFVENNEIKVDDYLKFSDILSWKLFQVSVSPEEILSHPELDWNYKIISRKFSLEYALEHPEIEWDYAQIQLKTHIDKVLAHPELDWDYSNLHRCPGFNFTYLLRYPQIKWSSILGGLKLSYRSYLKLKNFGINIKSTLHPFRGNTLFDEHIKFIKHIFMNEIKLNEMLKLVF